MVSLFPQILRHLPSVEGQIHLHKKEGEVSNCRYMDHWSSMLHADHFCIGTMHYCALVLCIISTILPVLRQTFDTPPPPTVHTLQTPLSNQPLNRNVFVYIIHQMKLYFCLPARPSVRKQIGYNFALIVHMLQQMHTYKGRICFLMDNLQYEYNLYLYHTYILEKNVQNLFQSFIFSFQKFYFHWIRSLYECAIVFKETKWFVLFETYYLVVLFLLPSLVMAIAYFLTIKELLKSVSGKSVSSNKEG